MGDKLIHKRIRKHERQGMICNYVEVTVSWDNGGVTRERLKDLEFIENESIKAEYIVPKTMELKDILGNIVYGGKDDTIKLLEDIAEAIIHGGISIDDVRIVSEEIRKGDIRTKNIDAIGVKWKKISFWYRLENKGQ